MLPQSEAGSFGWADLDHNRVNERLDTLEADIRREIDAPGGHFTEPKGSKDPTNLWSNPHCSAVYQFEALLMERGRGWVERAAQVYRDLAAQKCSSPGSNFGLAVLALGLQPFIKNKVSSLLLLAFRVKPTDRELLDPAYSACRGATEARTKYGAIQRILSELGSYSPAVLKFELPPRVELGSDVTREPAAQDQTKNSHPGNDQVRDGGSYRSPWKLAIYQGLLSLGVDASYQDVANWISERLPQTPLPKYCRSNNHDQVDLGYAVRHQRQIRDQFQRDLAKVRSDLRVRLKA